jgi:hypothetical protein
MSASNANLTPGNIQLSPMQVVFGGIDLGGTEGGVTVSPKYKIADIKEDQAGDTILDGVVSGEGFTVKFTLAETKAKSNWLVAFPHAQLITNGANQSVLFNLQIGDKLSLHAQLLTLHPLSSVPGDYSQDLTFYKAVAMSASEIKYGPDKQTGLQVEMTILPDTSVIPFRFMTFGDPTIGTINASFGAVTAGGGNVGNGTLTQIGVSNQFTKTETITALCVGQTSGNDFAVSGSQSGPLGDLHILAASGSSAHFVAALNPVVTFTLTQLGTQFAYGDTFTFPTSGANYT